MPTFEETREGYRNLLRSVKVTPAWVANFDKAAARIVQNKGRYQEIERETGVPWWWIAVVHDRESSGDFDGVLHNGEEIIGTDKKTSLEPPGRGPFDNWEEAAIDALRLKNLHKISDWSPERAAYEGERYNGFGYVGKINSPYLWAGSNLQQPGKYVRDGVYDPDHIDTQRGIIPLLKRLGEIDEDVRRQFWARLEPSEPGIPVPPSLPPQPMPQIEALLAPVFQERFNAGFLAGWEARAEAEAVAEAKALAELKVPTPPVSPAPKRRV